MPGSLPVRKITRLRSAMAMSTRLFLIEDHPMMRNGFKQFVASRPDFEWIGESSTGADALARLDNLALDLAVIDVHLPDMSGIEVADRILRKWPNARILMFSGDSDRALVDRALRVGVRGYVLKSAPLEELIKALETVLQGKLYFSTDVCASILEDYRKGLTDSSNTAKPAITDRDASLLKLIAQGRRTKEIAEEMDLTVKSVESYRSRLMKRLGCASTAELVRYAIREGLVAP